MDENPIANVSFQSNVARNAGDAFYIDEQMYRPAQDCNKCYGNGIEIQKVNKEKLLCLKPLLHSILIIQIIVWGIIRSI